MPLEIPEVVIDRLPVYARALELLDRQGSVVVSSQELGDHLGVTPAQIRKDLSYFGRFGKQGRGYNVKRLLVELRDNPQTIIVVEGFADPNERNAQSLADSRADAVKQFYTDNGIDPSRIVTIGLVQIKGVKTGPVCTQTRSFCDRSALDEHLEKQRKAYPIPQDY